MPIDSQRARMATLRRVRCVLEKEIGRVEESMISRYLVVVIRGNVIDKKEEGKILSVGII